MPPPYGVGLGMGQGGFGPRNLSGTLAAWFDPALGITLNTGNVQAWADQSGNGRNLSQGTVGAQPLFVASDANYNNKPLVQATATGKWLFSGAVALNQPVTFWVVGEFSSAGNVLMILGGAGSAPQIFSPVNVSINAGASLASGISGSAAPRTFLANFNGAASFVGVSNWLTGGTSGAAGANNGTVISLFGLSGGTFTTIGKIAEVVIQLGNPSAADKTGMASYFKTKFGITTT